ncbi:MAG: YraN family protein [Patescibacteria group bacterium]
MDNRKELGPSASLRTGRKGEKLAARFLESKGLSILERNFHTRFGEVDIIANDCDTIVFVEVKLRRSRRFGTAIESVDEEKLEKVTAAGERWLQVQGFERAPWRVDVVAIDGGRVEWLRGV